MCTGELGNKVLEEIYGVNFDDEVAKRMGLSPSLGKAGSEFTLAEANAIAADCESLQRNL